MKHKFLPTLLIAGAAGVVLDNNRLNQISSIFLPMIWVMEILAAMDKNSIFAGFNS